jgi:hypothetical protein
MKMSTRGAPASKRPPQNSAWLVAVQLLDGVGNGLFATLTGIVVADLMWGTGRYNLARGFVATVQGVGAALSNVVAGGIVVWAGYNTAFVILASVAMTGLAVLSALMPETAPRSFPQPRHHLSKRPWRKSMSAQLSPTLLLLTTALDATLVGPFPLITPTRRRTTGAEWATRKWSDQ